MRLERRPDSVRALALALAVALPTLAIVAAIARAELHRAEAKDWTFVAHGYDPRDLLRGHYVRFKIDFGEPSTGSACQESDADCCLCLFGSPGSGVPSTQRMTCKQALAQCDGILQTRAIRHLDRYYVPEDRARELDRRVRLAGSRDQLRVIVAIDSTGHGEVRALLIGDERLE